jgi:hypothetical protein
MMLYGNDPRVVPRRKRPSQHKIIVLTVIVVAAIIFIIIRRTVAGDTMITTLKHGKVEAVINALVFPPFQRHGISTHTVVVIDLITLIAAAIAIAAVRITLTVVAIES